MYDWGVTLFYLCCAESLTTAVIMLIVPFRVLSNLSPLGLGFSSADVRSCRDCGEAEEGAMRKGVSPLPGNEGGGSASTTRVFGVPLEEVTRTHTVSGHEVPALVKHIVEYIEEHGE